MSDYSQIRVDLEDKLRELVSRAREIDNDLSEPGDEDWEERAMEQENDEMLASLGNATLKEIEQIKDAIHKIDHGSYGVCDRCGAKIPKARLEALPFATTCTGCA